MLNDFKTYLAQTAHIPDKYIPHYIRWVTQAYRFVQKNWNEPLSLEQIKMYLNDISAKYEDWQINQAKSALRHYTYFLKKMNQEDDLTEVTAPSKEPWDQFIQKTVTALRLKQRAFSTEKTYLRWIRSFRYFLNDKNPYDLTAEDLQFFLSHLAVDLNVAPNTQNQALNALIFFFRYGLEKNIENMLDAVRARKKQKLPVVLTKDEIHAVFEHMPPNHRLMAKVIYGGGLRLMECLRLRVKDVDFKQEIIWVRSGKGDKDRNTLLPASIKEELQNHLKIVRKLYEQDRQKNIPGVELPHLLNKKYPNAPTEWQWYWFFPSRYLSVDPRSNTIRRHHVHPGSLQKAFKTALRRAEVAKHASIHTLRHSFATHLIEAGYDVRTVQELFGHKGTPTTEIYTHIAKVNFTGIKSPLD